jgi:hypothetical protein
MAVFRRILLRLRYESDKTVQKNKTRILCSAIFFSKKLLLWDNVEKYCRAEQTTDDNMILLTLIACWITKATNIHWEYVVLIAFPQQQCLHERASILRYTHIACLVYVKLHCQRSLPYYVFILFTYLNLLLGGVFATLYILISMPLKSLLYL